MAVDVTTEIEIGRPRDEVAAYASDPDNATSWYQNIKSVDWQTPPPLAVGSRLLFTAGFMGRSLTYTYQVREHAPGERFVMSTDEGPFAAISHVFPEYVFSGSVVPGRTFRRR